MRNSDGTFKKGVSGNPDGKPKGAISEKTKEWHGWGDYIIGQNMPPYVQSLNKMLLSDDEKERAEGMKRYEVILEYFQPKLSRTEFSGDLKTDDGIDYSQLSDQALKEIANAKSKS